MILPSLYAKTSKGKLTIWTVRTQGPNIVTEWGEVTGETQTSVVQCEGKNIGRSNETTPGEQADKEAQAKWAAKKLKKYYESPEEAMGTLNIKPMRAYSLDDKRKAKLKFPVDMQPKLDGVRCMAYLLPGGSVRLMSRGGKDYTVPLVSEALEGKLSPGMALDGELYIEGESLQSIRHLMADEDPRVTFYVYDYTALPANSNSWAVRRTQLATWFAAHEGNLGAVVVPVETETANDLGDVKELHDDWVDQGYEGAMVRTMGGKYKLAGKSTDLLKVKMFQDDEFRVVGWDTGRDGVVRYKCIQEEGLEFEVRPVGTMEQRAKLLEQADSHIGQLLTVKFQQRSDDNIPIFPVGKSFRPASDLD